MQGVVDKVVLEVVVEVEDNGFKAVELVTTEVYVVVGLGVEEKGLVLEVLIDDGELLEIAIVVVDDDDVKLDFEFVVVVELIEANNEVNFEVKL